MRKDDNFNDPRSNVINKFSTRDEIADILYAHFKNCETIEVGDDGKLPEFLNIDEGSLSDPKFINYIKDCITEFNTAPVSVIEPLSVIIKENFDKEKIMDVLNCIYSLGCDVSLDENGNLPDYFHFEKPNPDLFKLVVDAVSKYNRTEVNQKEVLDNILKGALIRRDNENNILFLSPELFDSEIDLDKLVVDVNNVADDDDFVYDKSLSLNKEMLDSFEECYNLLKVKNAKESLLKLHFSRIAKIESFIIEIKDYKINKLTKAVDDIYNYVLDHLKDEHLNMTKNILTEFIFLEETAKNQLITQVNNQYNAVYINLIRNDYQKVIELYNHSKK